MGVLVKGVLPTTGVKQDRSAGRSSPALSDYSGSAEYFGASSQGDMLSPVPPVRGARLGESSRRDSYNAGEVHS